MKTRSSLLLATMAAHMAAFHAKVYAALIVMAVFFSTIMTILFKVRDRVLVWQKGVIKW